MRGQEGFGSFRSVSACKSNGKSNSYDLNYLLVKSFSFALFCEESVFCFSRALTKVLRIMMAASLEFIFKLYFGKKGSFS